MASSSDFGLITLVSALIPDQLDAVKDTVYEINYLKALITFHPSPTATPSTNSPTAEPTGKPHIACIEALKNVVKLDALTTEPTVHPTSTR